METFAIVPNTSRAPWIFVALVLVLGLEEDSATREDVQRLRDEVDLATLEKDVMSVVGETVRLQGTVTDDGWPPDSSAPSTPTATAW